MKKQLLNIFLILIVAACVFTLFWKPARTQRKATIKMSAQDLVNSNPNQDEPREIKKKRLTTYASLQRSKPLALEDRQPTAVPVLNSTSIKDLHEWALKYSTEIEVNESFKKIPNLSKSDTGQLLKLFHALFDMPPSKKSAGSSAVEEKILNRLSQSSLETYQEIIDSFNLAQDHPHIEASFMKVVYRLDIPKMEKAAYYKKIYKRRFDNSPNEKSLRLKKNVPEARLYLDFMNMLPD